MKQPARPDLILGEIENLEGDFEELKSVVNRLVKGVATPTEKKNGFRVIEGIDHRIQGLLSTLRDMSGHEQPQMRGPKVIR